jgi:hypothetical protein
MDMIDKVNQCCISLFSCFNETFVGYTWFSFDLVFPTLWQDWIEALFATGCVFLNKVGCVFFVVHHDKGMCPSFLGVCNGCVVQSAIRFYAHGPPPITFGLSTIGFGNVNWIIRLCQALIITVVLSLVGGKAKLVDKE